MRKQGQDMKAPFSLTTGLFSMFFVRTAKLRRSNMYESRAREISQRMSKDVLQGVKCVLPKFSPGCKVADEKPDRTTTECIL